MDRLLLVVLILSSVGGLVLFTYPLLVYARALVIKRPVMRATTFVNPVSIIIAAYNEEIFIKEKLLFFLNKEEWIPGSEIIIVSAGSTDGTNKLLKEFEGRPEIKIIIIKEHLAKAQALNSAVAQSKNDILIFSDCRQDIKKGSVAVLVSYFNDSTIGTVNSTISDTKTGGKISTVRWILNSICFNESISGSSLNLHGALYAQRRDVFRPFPQCISFDDLFAIISTLTQHKRLVQAKDAVIYDINFTHYYKKNRLERNTQGLILFLTEYWPAIKKLPAGILIRFLIYRYLKLLLPFLILGILLPLLWFMPFTVSKEMAGSFMLLVAGLLLYKKSRQFILLTLKVNLYFTITVFKFCLLKKRELYWEKLVLE